VIYTVNFLLPKPWIQAGGTLTSTPAPDPQAWWNKCYGKTTLGEGVASNFVVYPGAPPAGNDFSFLWQRTAEEALPRFNFPNGKPEAWALEEILANRIADSSDPLNPAYAVHPYTQFLNKEFIRWHLENFAISFANANKVPLYVNQFGADTAAVGQRVFERDLLEVMEKNLIHWTRWGYNAGSSGRKLVLTPGQPAGEATAVQAAINFYTGVGSRTANSTLVAYEIPAGTSATTRLRAEHYSGQTSANPDNYRWTFGTNNGAYDNTRLTASAVGSAPAVTIASSNVAAAPRADFRLYFNQTGNYQVWIRMKNGLTTNGVWLGLNGTVVSDCASATPSGWGWVNRGVNFGNRSKINVTTTGYHTLNVWMSRSGVDIDEIIIAASGTYTPPSSQSQLPAFATRRIDLPTP
jgi:Gylcosyl hydrolase family 115 C-terminal domain